MNDLQELNDERAITRVLLDYCRAVDRGDIDLLKTVYHDDAMELRGVFEGPASTFVGFVAASVEAGQEMSHATSNFRIDLDGDAADVESYVVATITLTHPDGDKVHEVLGARFLDRFERRDGHWRIAVRRTIFDWSRTDPVTERTYWSRTPSPDYRMGSRSLQDPSYVSAAVGNGSV
ncbi:MAG: hypothetical protein QOF76_3386 [Solirubrobacteraceae bacterium]|jgi:ketosteroid isomerase-like protein|nr:hypothetical protein [Solirubrobacteraceae bacterium]